MASNQEAPAAQTRFARRYKLWPSSPGRRSLHHWLGGPNSSAPSANPVSCAAGLAVLDVIEREGLQQNAQRMGVHLRAGIDAIAQDRLLIGDVRGMGLFLGVELVRNHTPLEPAAEEARKRVGSLSCAFCTTGK